MPNLIFAHCKISSFDYRVYDCHGLRFFVGWRLCFRWFGNSDRSTSTYGLFDFYFRCSVTVSGGAICVSVIALSSSLYSVEITFVQLSCSQNE